MAVRHHHLPAAGSWLGSSQSFLSVTSPRGMLLETSWLAGEANMLFVIRELKANIGRHFQAQDDFAAWTASTHDGYEELVARQIGRPKGPSAFTQCAKIVLMAEIQFRKEELGVAEIYHRHCKYVLVYNASRMWSCMFLTNSTYLFCLLASAPLILTSSSV